MTLFTATRRHPPAQFSRHNFIRHRGWLTLSMASIAFLMLALPQMTSKRDGALAALTVIQDRNAIALKEARALQEDVAEEASLRRSLGEKTYQALFTPPPRAQLVADLRQIGLETGLQHFGLTMEQATWLTPAGKMEAAGNDLTATALHIQARAPDDRSIYNFTMRALDELPGYLKLDKLSLKRIAGSGDNPVVIIAEIDLRWLALNEDLLFSRQQP